MFEQATILQKLIRMVESPQERVELTNLLSKMSKAFEERLGAGVCDLLKSEFEKLRREVGESLKEVKKEAGIS